jgi:class 3 adenylate cyclase
MKSSQASPDGLLTPELAEVARQLASARGASTIVDKDMRLVWVSDELRQLFGNPSDDDLKLGANIVEAYMTGVWASFITFESQMKMFVEDFPKVMYTIPKPELMALVRRCWAEWPDAPSDLDESVDVDQIIAQLFEGLEPVEPPPFYTNQFEFIQGDLPPARITEFCMALRNDAGERIGLVIMFDPALPATVMNLVARGDEEMYGRMARLTRPGRHKAAVLFADLQSSAVLSRRLPSAAYFKLIRAITTAMDEVVVQQKGIVGKHAGDGVTAFFLCDDLGSDSATARAAIEAARKITEAAARAAKQVGDETGLIESADCHVNVGLHWGGALYMGQLVTGGRLEVTALGDRVNEAARIQESARDGEVLASKSLIEHLADDDAAALGLDADGVIYRTVSELESASEKAVRDAGGIPVTII